MPTVEHTCECGVMFMATSKALRCPECSAKWKREYQRQYYHCIVKTNGKRSDTEKRRARSMAAQARYARQSVPKGRPKTILYSSYQLMRKTVPKFVVAVNRIIAMKLGLAEQE